MLLTPPVIRRAFWRGTKRMQRQLPFVVCTAASRTCDYNHGRRVVFLRSKSAVYNAVFVFDS